MNQLEEAERYKKVLIDEPAERFQAQLNYIKSCNEKQVITIPITWIIIAVLFILLILK